MKYEWRKKEKALYLPPTRPVAISVPCLRYFVMRGQGNPNSPQFGEYIEALYAASYAVRMSYKRGLEPEGFYEYTVYPLEGVWDLTEKGRAQYDGKVDKDELVFTLMIRQPDFVTPDYAAETLSRVQGAKGDSNPRIAELAFEEFNEGACVQMLHLGSFENEATSFAEMEAWCADQGLRRQSKIHKEIYLSDPRKVCESKLKTVLCFGVEEA